MGRRIDLAGQRFNRWLVISEAGRAKDGTIIWLCRCDCGAEGDVRGANLRRGVSASCGCIQRETATRHGLHAHRLYSTWVNMIHRCSNPASKDYERYGARGITVCQRWADRATGLQSFVADMDGSYEPGMSLDRRDNELGYSPENCTWATATDQNRNRRSNRLITHEGRIATVAEWAEATGITPTTITRRLDRGWSVSRALTQPAQ